MARKNEVELLKTKFYSLHIISVEKFHEKLLRQNRGSYGLCPLYYYLYVYFFILLLSHPPAFVSTINMLVSLGSFVNK